MKNEAIAGEGSGALRRPPGATRWPARPDLRRRGAAENTRAVYGRDAGEFAAWAAAYALEPADVDYPWLRRYAA